MQNTKRLDATLREQREAADALWKQAQKESDDARRKYNGNKMFAHLMFVISYHVLIVGGMLTGWMNPVLGIALLFMLYAIHSYIANEGWL